MIVSGTLVVNGSLADLSVPEQSDLIKQIKDAIVIIVEATAVTPTNVHVYIDPNTGTVHYAIVADCPTDAEAISTAFQSGLATIDIR